MKFATEAAHAPLESWTRTDAVRDATPGDTVACGGVTVISVPAALITPGWGGETRWVPSPKSGGPAGSLTKNTCAIPLSGAKPVPPIVIATGLLDVTAAGGAPPLICVIVGAL